MFFLVTKSVKEPKMIITQMGIKKLRKIFFSL
jgi:hypothetical protein